VVAMKGAVDADVSKVGPRLYSDLEVLMLGPGFGFSVLYKDDATVEKEMTMFVVENFASPMANGVSDEMGT